jgi:hypothetical protein
MSGEDRPSVDAQLGSESKHVESDGPLNVKKAGLYVFF